MSEVHRCCFRGYDATIKITGTNLIDFHLVHVSKVREPFHAFKHLLCPLAV